MNYIFGHTENNPLVIDDYPYGFRQRTQIRYYIETVPKRGDRFVSQTLNPKTNEWNRPNKSTYYDIGVMFIDPANGHVHWKTIGKYTSREEKEKFINDIGGIERLDVMQRARFTYLSSVN